MADNGDVAPPSASARRRARLGAAAVALVGMAAAMGWGATSPRPAGAQETEVIDDPRLAPSLAGVQVQSDGYAKARAASRAAADQLAQAKGRLADLDEKVASLSTERDRLEAEITEATDRGQQARTELDRHRTSLRTLAVESYVQGRGTGTDGFAKGAEAAAADARVDALVNDVARLRSEQVREAQRAIDETDRTISDDTASLATVGSELDEAASSRDDATREVEVRQRAADGARRTMADWRLTADVVGSDLPLVALDAYVKASVRMAFERPECGLRWSGLAGVGKVESGHGTYGGSRLTAAGDTSQPIVGIPLDGTNGTAVVGDTDGGRWDGDPTVDRAVGPMQFIPGAWAALGRDGNGDGRADPSNIYDAALAAAGLLCRAGGSGLDTDAGLSRAALGYNNSGAYASLVVRTANAYQAREAELIPPPPPTTTTTTTAPPADPGIPAAPPASAPPVTAAADPAAAAPG
jgi:membrane-bound lytic murein transglycosylase B